MIPTTQSKQDTFQPVAPAGLSSLYCWGMCSGLNAGHTGLSPLVREAGEAPA